jgi:hypothetical protein
VSILRQHLDRIQKGANMIDSLAQSTSGAAVVEFNEETGLHEATRKRRKRTKRGKKRKAEDGEDDKVGNEE